MSLDLGLAKARSGVETRVGAVGLGLGLSPELRMGMTFGLSLR